MHDERDLRVPFFFRRDADKLLAHASNRDTRCQCSQGTIACGPRSRSWARRIGGDLWIRRSRDCWERWLPSARWVRRKPRLPRTRRKRCGRIPSRNYSNRSRTRQRFCRRPMNSHRLKTPTGMCNWRSTITIITIITRIAAMCHGSSWCPDIGITIITIITTIAVIERRTRPDATTTGPLGFRFFALRTHPRFAIRTRRLLRTNFESSAP